MRTLVVCPCATYVVLCVCACGPQGIIKLLQEYGADFGIEELVNTFGNKYPNQEPVKPRDVEPF